MARHQGESAGHDSRAGFKGQGKLRARHQSESAGYEGRARSLGRTQGQGAIHSRATDAISIRASALVARQLDRARQASRGRVLDISTHCLVAARLQCAVLN
jgi:hypothetical protein